MSELTFANYRIDVNAVSDVYCIGAMKENLGSGVVEEIARVFDYPLLAVPDEANLGGLIGKVGPAKELQQNIGLVQEVLGTDKDAVGILSDWVNRSGLLIPVEQSFVKASLIRKDIDLAIITGGVRNWMARRATRLEKLSGYAEVKKVLLVGGQREMSEKEGDDVVEGFREADYMSKVLLDRLTDRGFEVEVLEAETAVGDEVMDTLAHELKNDEAIDLSADHIVVVSNAAAWLLNVGQVRRAIRKIAPEFDEEGEQLTAVSDMFPLGTGTEPTSTHQNPYSAIGQLLRNAQELVKQY